MEREWTVAAPLRLTAVPSRSAPFSPPTPGEITVWRLACPPSLPLPDIAWDLLDAAERAQAIRFRREADRRLYVFSHAMLRCVLAAATGRPAQDIAFARTDHGKPYLPDGPHCNLSHAGEYALAAVCPDAPVGLDVEPLRELPDADGLVERFFAPRERIAYANCPAGHRHEAFFTLWTRKEAYCKALGVGLTVALPDFAVSLDTPARVLSPLANAIGPAPRLWDIPVKAGYVGALAGWATRLRIGDVLP